MSEWVKTSFTHGNFIKYLYNKVSVLPKSRALINLHKDRDICLKTKLRKDQTQH